MMRAKLIAINMLILCNIAFSNDGSYIIQGTGGSVMPIQNNSIVMQSEEIIIDVLPIALNSYTVKYTCSFTFYNTTNSVQNVLMGFPHRYNKIMSQTHTIEGKENSVSKFEFIVNGRTISYKVFSTEANPNFTKVPAYEEVRAAEVRFMPNEKINIVNIYFLEKTIDCVPSRMFGIRDTEKTFETIEYIMTTGASWKDPIGKAEVLINFHLPADFFHIGAEPSGYVISEKPYQLKYTFINYVPKEDIKIVFRLKKIAIDDTMKRISYYYKLNEFKTAEALLWKWDITTISDKKNIKTKDLVRNIAYKIAYKFYNSDLDAAYSLYLIALHHARSHRENDYLLVEYPENESELYSVLATWEQEGKDNSPCYFIVYNIACILTKKGDLEKARMWFNTACKMRPELLEYSKTDPDLADLIKIDK